MPSQATAATIYKVASSAQSISHEQMEAVDRQNRIVPTANFCQSAQETIATVNVDELIIPNFAASF